MCHRAVTHVSVCCHSVDGHPLPIDELKGIKAVESIDLSGKKLGIMSTIIIGACIAGNAHLRELKCALPPNPSESAILGAVARHLGVVAWLPHLWYLVVLAAVLAMVSKRREPR